MLLVEPIYADKTLGICGTFNWNQKDDFLTLEGDVEFSSDRFVERFTNCMQSEQLSENQYLDQCDLHPERRDKTLHLCSFLPSSQAHCRQVLISSASTTIQSMKYKEHIRQSKRGYSFEVPRKA